MIFPRIKLKLENANFYGTAEGLRYLTVVCIEWKQEMGGSGVKGQGVVKRSEDGFQGQGMKRISRRGGMDF